MTFAKSMRKTAGGHDGRMRRAAALGKEGGAQVEELYGRLERESAWVGMYGVVAAMAGGRGEVLERVALGSRSWVLRARAVQALSKVRGGGEALGALLGHQDTPLQLKPLIVGSLRSCTAEVVETVLATPLLGGAWGALLLLQRSPKSEQHEKLVREYFRRLCALTTLEDKPNEREVLAGRRATVVQTEYKHGRMDLCSVYQSMAVKYPQFMLKVLREQTDFDFRWYRASRELAASHPQELLDVLRVHRESSRAVWFVARPLVRHLPLEVLRTFTAVTGSFVWCLRKRRRDAAYRAEALTLLEGGLKPACAKDAESAVKLLLRMLGDHGCEAGRIPDAVCSLVGGATWTKTRAAQLVELLEAHYYDDDGKKKKKKEKVVPPFAPSAKAAYNLVRRDLEERKMALSSLEAERHGFLGEAARDFFEREENAAVAEGFVVREATSRGFVPRGVVEHTLRSFVGKADYTDIETVGRCRVLVDAGIGFAEPLLKKLAETREPDVREVVLKSLWECVCRSAGCGNKNEMKKKKKKKKEEEEEKSKEERDACAKGAAPVLAWIVSRLSKEEAAVKGPVVEALLEVGGASPVLGDPSLGALEELFGYSLKWGQGVWMEAWGQWVTEVLVHFRDMAKGGGGELVTFAEQVLKRMQAAEVIDENEIVRNLAQAALDVPSVDKVALNSVGMHMLRHVGKFVPAEQAAEEDYYFYRNWETGEKRVGLNLNMVKEIMDLLGGEAAGWRVLAACKPLSDHVGKLLTCDHTRNTAKLYTEKYKWCNTLDVSTLPDMKKVEDRVVWVPWEEAVCAAVRCLGTSDADDSTISHLNTMVERLPLIDYNLEKRELPAQQLAVIDECGKVLRDVNKYIKEHCFCEDATSFTFDQAVNLISVFVANLPEHPAFIEHCKSLVDLCATCDSSAEETLYFVLRHISHPTPATREIFEYTWEHANMSNIDQLVEYFHFCETRADYVKRYGEYKELREPEHIPEHTDLAQLEAYVRKLKARRPRFRFQRGARAEGRRERIRELKAGTAKHREEVETWPAEAVVKAIERLDANPCDVTRALGILLHDKNFTTRCRRMVVVALLKVASKFRVPSCREKSLPRLPTGVPGVPEVAEFMKKHARRDPEGAVACLLKPYHLMKRRGAEMLKSGLTGVSPQKLFAESRTFQAFVLRYHPEEVLRLLDEDNAGSSLGALATQVTVARFGGQTTTCAWYLHTLPPNVQRHLWDKWIEPHAFVTSGGDLLEEDDDGCHAVRGRGGTESGNASHKAKARRLWVGAALSSAEGMKPLWDEGHPFNKFLARTVSDRMALREAAEAEKEEVKKSDRVTELTLEGARAAQLALELLLALRTADDAEGSLRVLVEHIDRGVASKVAIPSTACALRCVGAAKAAEVLRAVLQRRGTRASARSQLGRCCVQLLGPEAVEEFVETEWREGGWVMVGDGAASAASSEGDGVFTSTKVALLCSLVTNAWLLARSEGLWRRVETLADNDSCDEGRTDENKYIAQQVLASLAGTNGVATLNTKSWPLAAPAGLAALVASFVSEKSVEATVGSALQKFFKSVSVSGKAPAAVDVEGVVREVLRTSDATLLREMVGALSPHCEGLLARLCKAKRETIETQVGRGSIRSVLDVQKVLSEVCGGDPMGLSKGECKEAVEELVKHPATVRSAFRLVATQLARKKGQGAVSRSGSLDDGLRLAAWVLDTQGPGCVAELMAVGVHEGDLGELPGVLWGYLEAGEAVGVSLRLATLALIEKRGAEIKGSGVVLEFIAKMMRDKTQVAAGALRAYSALGCSDRLTYAVYDCEEEDDEESCGW